jgi:hypothetical protein
MTILLGGGSLALKTDTFDNGEPTGLLVRDFLSTPVLEPVPPLPPEPNNVQSINFFGKPAGGFVLSRNLRTVDKNLFFSGAAAQQQVLESSITIRTADNKWVAFRPFVRTDSGWSSLPVRIWTGVDWQTT